MTISFHDLRDIKHRLPTGSVHRIAEELDIDEQTVRDYFGASKSISEGLTARNVEAGTDGAVVCLHDTTIYDAAQRILNEGK